MWELELIAKVDEVEEEGSGDLTTEVVVAAVVVEEVEVVEGGKTSPFLRGRGRTGLGAVPTNFPCPGKVDSESLEEATAGTAVAAAAAAFAARNLAALA